MEFCIRPLAKLALTLKKIKENAEAFIQTVIKLKPASAKGTYVKSVYMSSTMGPSIPVSKVGLVQ